MFTQVSQTKKKKSRDTDTEKEREVDNRVLIFVIQIENISLRIV